MWDAFLRHAKTCNIPVINIDQGHGNSHDCEIAVESNHHENYGSK